MKVYFLASPRAKNDFSDHFKKIYQTIDELGHTNVTKFLLEVDKEKFYSSNIVDFCRETVKLLKQADICVFEASLPSLAVGHLISIALQNSKPVIALYTDKKMPFFLSGLQDEKIQIVEYDMENIKEQLKDAIQYAQEMADTRFNFFISPKQVNYLDDISKQRKIPKSVYLRELIDGDMSKNEEFAAENS